MRTRIITTLIFYHGLLVTLFIYIYSGKYALEMPDLVREFIWTSFIRLTDLILAFDFRLLFKCYFVFFSDIQVFA